MEVQLYRVLLFLIGTLAVTGVAYIVYRIILKAMTLWRINSALYPTSDIFSGRVIFTPDKEYLLSVMDWCILIVDMLRKNCIYQGKLDLELVENQLDLKFDILTTLVIRHEVKQVSLNTVEMAMLFTYVAIDEVINATYRNAKPKTTEEIYRDPMIRINPLEVEPDEDLQVDSLSAIVTKLQTGANGYFKHEADDKTLKHVFIGRGGKSLDDLFGIRSDVSEG